MVFLMLAQATSGMLASIVARQNAQAELFDRAVQQVDAVLAAREADERVVTLSAASLPEGRLEILFVLKSSGLLDLLDIRIVVAAETANAALIQVGARYLTQETNRAPRHVRRFPNWK